MQIPDLSGQPGKLVFIYREGMPYPSIVSGDVLIIFDRSGFRIKKGFERSLDRQRTVKDIILRDMYAKVIFDDGFSFEGRIEEIKKEV